MLRTKTAAAAVSPLEDDGGSFDILLSSATKDRDGDVLLPEQWQTPLPAQIAVNIDHSKGVASVIGSGRPFLDAQGNLRLVGKFAGSELGQNVRRLVTEGHVTGASVEFLKHRSEDGTVSHELVGAGLVTLPSNRDARVLSSKGTQLLSFEEFSERLRSIHDGSVSLGAQCPAVPDETDANKAAALRLRLKALTS